MQPMFHHILIILRQTAEDQYTLQKAQRLAACQPCHFSIFIANPVKLPRPDPQLVGSLTKQQLSELSAVTSDYLISENKGNAEIHWLRNYLNESDISLVITAPLSGSGLLPGLYDKLCHFLINDCELPVWLVKTPLPLTEDSILACLDIEDASLRNQHLNEVILQVAAELANALGEPLHLLNCFQDELMTMDLSYDTAHGFKKHPDELGNHQRLLQSYLLQGNVVSPCQIHIKEGCPDNEVPLVAAQLQAGLTLIGNNHCHSRLSAVLGNTAHYLCQQTPTDMLVLKPGTVIAGRQVS
ncbi:UspA domain-containing protein [Alishewanella agri BL06]|uniref:UspA domain-containing protein n=1 Tax=Alishewanella agri BL06 TaxID=1195246 RepID=I8U492_9ALTE|nr:universal stress protein [Alishewanella agri]EIW88151.1 UspA domain-containing protein [Alishewanella agri BL06]